MEKVFLTSFMCKPAVQNSKDDDYHFKIPRKYIRMGIIDPDKIYELRLIEFDESK